MIDLFFQLTQSQRMIALDEILEHLVASGAPSRYDCAICDHRDGCSYYASEINAARPAPYELPFRACRRWHYAIASHFRLLE
jgi:hypothetical protein